MTPPRPSWGQLVHGCKAFHKEDPKDPFYRAPQWLLERVWAPEKGYDLQLSAAAIGILSIAWNTAYYRGQEPDFVVLESFLAENRTELSGLRKRSIDSYEAARDDSTILRLHSELRTALSIESNGMRRLAHVPAGKVLHLLAPTFLPIWDQYIADAWGCYWNAPVDSNKSYRDFVGLSQTTLLRLGSWEDLVQRCNRIPEHKGGPLKLLDEWNYETFSR